MVSTFLPYADFDQSAQCLDRKRLNSTKNETAIILALLMGKPTKEGRQRTGWRNHPATRMWRDHRYALMMYHNAIITEWVRRGYKTTMDTWILPVPIFAPPWLGDDRVHSSHRMVLLSKDFEHYSQFGWEEEPAYAYFWPC